MIKTIGNVILVGTSHVSEQSMKEIKKAIDENKPDVVCIELDIDRFKSLMAKPENKKKELKKRKRALKKEVGMSGYIFAQIAGYVQKKVGDSLGIEPGSDMKTAFECAKAEKIPVALIDLNIRNTLKKMSKLGFRKKISMFSNLFIKSFKKEYRDKLNFDVKKGVPDEKVIIEMLKIVKKEVPDMYRILIDDRNKHMCKKIMEYREKHEGYVMAVVGAGHVEGMVEILEKEISDNEEKVTIGKVTDSGLSMTFNVNVEEDKNGF